MDSAKPTDQDHRIIQGDCLAVLRTLPDESVQCCVTSPPYFGLRDYGTAEWDISNAEDAEIAGKCDHKGEPMRTRAYVNQNCGTGNDVKNSENHQPMRSACAKCGAVRVDKQIGLEATPAEFVAKMVEVFEEVRRVLRKDGTLWLNLGDSYANDAKWGGSTGGKHANGLHGDTSIGRTKTATGMKPKDLMGMPWRVAFALQEAGWWLRQDIIWSKPNPMPESVTDRCTKAHEYIFLLTKSAKYFYDAEAVKESCVYDDPRMYDDYEPSRPDRGFVGAPSRGGGPLNKARGDANAFRGQGHFREGDNGPANRDGRDMKEVGSGSTRNKRSVWTVTTQPMPDAHFATFPPKLIEPCILAGTSEKGCCASCGSPWERVVEKSGGTIGKAWHDHDEAARLSIGQRGGTDVRAGWDTYRVEHLGWQKTCKCETDEVKPCVVLDPFNGAGTTMLVSKRLGRHSIGIELNPEYIKIAERRLEHWHRTQPPRLAKQDSALGPLFELMEAEQAG
jgi:DNA modification methylase